MNLYDLKQIDLNAGSPPETLNNRQWQEYFRAMRLLVAPCKEKRLKANAVEFSENGSGAHDRCSTSRESQWYYYCQFINSILAAIRKGQDDYCFNVYHITELLKFEHDNLRTEWLPESRCFRVWLDL